MKQIKLQDYISKFLYQIKIWFKNITNKSKVIRKGIVITSAILLIIASLITSNYISRSVFEIQKENLNAQKVNTIDIALLPDKDINSLIQKNNIASMYENTNFYMFKFTKEDFYLSKNKEDNYSASIYIQKPNNVLEYSSSKNYKSVSTDKFIINISFRQRDKDARKIDLLFLNKKDDIKRLDNYKINNISFETYEIISQDHIKYCMVSDPIGDMYLIYSIIYYDTQEVKNFNYLSHVVFDKNTKNE